MVHILTHNDLDGYASGYIVSDHFSSQEKAFTILNYDKEPDLSKIKPGDIVTITDYSLTNSQYREILERVGDDGQLIWCDHHVTAIDRYNEDEDLAVDGIRSIKYCGAVLTWCYFNDIDTDDIENTPYDELILKIPHWLRLVDAWDTWKLDSKYREEAEALNLAVQSNLSMDLMAKLRKCYRDYVEIGRSYRDFRNQWSKALRDQYLFYKIQKGDNFGVDRMITLAILNVGNANSEFFGNEINKADVCVTMCFDGKKWKVSLYSNKSDIDCSKAAKMFGGGGHKGAAGCYFEQLTPPIFTCEDGEIIKVVKEKD